MSPERIEGRPLDLRSDVSAWVPLSTSCCQRDVRSKAARQPRLSVACCPGDDLQARDVRQRVDHLFGQAIAEMRSSEAEPLDGLRRSLARFAAEPAESVVAGSGKAVRRASNGFGPTGSRRRYDRPQIPSNMSRATLRTTAHHQVTAVRRDRKVANVWLARELEHGGRHG